MSQSTAMLGLFTETSLHAGTGQMLGVIDLPIQRESHTGWPCVYGSAVKGAMRELAEKRGHKKTWVEDVFGPEMQNASDHAGALAITDARLLLLPVRSLTGHFKWLTCPAVLQRWQADCRRLGLPDGNDFSVTNLIENNKALVSQTLKEQDIFLEEFRFKTQPRPEIDKVIRSVAKLIGREPNEIDKALKSQLTVVNDNMFAHLSRFATPVNAHIAIDNETKTVKTGALWYEESLPADTLLYTGLVAQASRKDGNKKANEVLKHVVDDLFSDEHPYLQLGGNETVGMGWCCVKVLHRGN
ncbi:CRISPR-associated protein Cmr4 [Candidatus Thiomargarita nelsonii]|uniref:CRISPR-associated protein Cmr4 n=1 Tax=Candidatus Thiomargarita nelsonii TaxID=1003181 RepID=A0A0A6P2N6_9GAMM|nr:CRISPR-associated protein Cmr4 [Candidatus Thiomargarita nelsonii]